MKIAIAVPFKKLRNTTANAFIKKGTAFFALSGFCWEKAAPVLLFSLCPVTIQRKGKTGQWKEETRDIR